MTKLPRIIDNRNERLIDFLRPHLQDAKLFRLVSAYFSIHGFEAMADELESVEETRFLFGSPASIQDLNEEEREHRKFVIDEEGISLLNSLNKRNLAKRCARWILKNNTHIKTIADGFMHGKTYQIETRRLESDATVTGSSNFTKNGLGANLYPNLEINIASEDEKDCIATKRWFDELWQNEELVVDAKQQVLNSLNRRYINHSPQLIYYKCLYEIFKDRIDAIEKSEEHSKKLEESQIWNELYDFQKEAVKRIVSNLEEFGGSILADSTGLGKTYTALAVIKWYLKTNGLRVLVLCPKRLENNWMRYSSRYLRSSNPFKEDNLDYTVLFHSDLNREKGMSNGINLKDIAWDCFDLVVIDESHNFRNASTHKDGRKTRYQRIIEDIVKSGAHTKVLLLSATPINISLDDLHNQIKLMVGGQDDVFSNHNELNIKSLRLLFKGAQKAFNKWSEITENVPNIDDLCDAIGKDFFNLLACTTIARSRKQIETLYKRDSESIMFPEQREPKSKSPQLDLDGKIHYENLQNLISDLNLAIYHPHKYTKSKINNKRDHSERALIGMMCMNLLKRLESSPLALEKTLERMLTGITKTKNKIVLYQNQSSGSSAINPLDDSDQKNDIESDYEDFRDDGEEWVVNPNVIEPVPFRDLNLQEWNNDISKDFNSLLNILGLVRTISTKRDGKINQLLTDIKHKLKDKSKILIFTGSTDTAMYIYDTLLDSFDNLRCGVVTGTSYDSNCIKFTNVDDILDHFSPESRNVRNSINQNEEIQILIGTDCISEGQNFQDCDTVLNYDVHWNPVRLIQRFGRIDRIGTKHKTVGVETYWPPIDLEKYLNVKKKIGERLAIGGLTGGDTINISDQLKHIKSEKKLSDIENIDTNIALSDLTFDSFIHQLIKFLQKRKNELKNIPVPSLSVLKQQIHLPPGLIFLFKVKNEDNLMDYMLNNSLFPFFFIYQTKYGTHIEFNKSREILNLLSNYVEPLHQVDHSSFDGFDFSFSNDPTPYALMLVDSLSRLGEDIHDHLELISWFVIQED